MESKGRLVLFTNSETGAFTGKGYYQKSDGDKPIKFSQTSLYAVQWDVVVPNQISAAVHKLLEIKAIETN